MLQLSKCCPLCSPRALKLSQAETCFLIGQISRNGRCSDMELMYSPGLWGASLSLSVSHCACVRTGCYIKQLTQLYSDTAANMNSLQELLRALDRLLSGVNKSLVLKLLKKKKRWCSFTLLCSIRHAKCALCVLVVGDIKRVLLRFFLLLFWSNLAAKNDSQQGRKKEKLIVTKDYVATFVSGEAQNSESCHG